MKLLRSAIGIAALLGLAACQGKTDVSVTDNGTTPNGPPQLHNPGSPTGPTGPQAPPPAAHCAVGQSYIGFNGNDLAADRLDEAAGMDRDLLQPYSSLQGAYTLALGSTPSLVSQMGSTFGSPGPRWYMQQKSNAISAYGALRIAFQGCLTATASATQYAAAPDGNTAPANCIAWEKAYWNRTPTNDEAAICADFAINQTTAESDPRRRWAYACAAVLSSAQFLGY
jgi:hypothetical protein